MKVYVMVVLTHLEHVLFASFLLLSFWKLVFLTSKILCPVRCAERVSWESDCMRLFLRGWNFSWNETGFKEAFEVYYFQPLLSGRWLIMNFTRNKLPAGDLWSESTHSNFGKECRCLLVAEDMNYKHCNVLWNHATHRTTWTTNVHFHHYLFLSLINLNLDRTDQAAICLATSSPIIAVFSRPSTSSSYF